MEKGDALLLIADQAGESLLQQPMVICSCLAVEMSRFDVPIAMGGLGLALGVSFRKDVPNGGLANVAATVMNLHGFKAPSDYEPTLVEVVDN